ncbi:DUF488 domain-containing protein [Furfurilactobacillus siliginis]|uniref:Uroporphyrin-III C-methyltransferase n=1 Tax=Furfurilactobacillus siliginis TaxID=348151 RepID=A0A0R2L5M3_9LACO|nr:DUF488 domain-containing protein [Furfurilactobacillus siliginis]KRN97038.1 hypothetical protein IV55_GL000916 [Furfurilactobacillus siliginis]GEK27799.1 hypothetical protein LSI01_01100 [Furfurilactobacillus siliginis]
MLKIKRIYEAPAADDGQRIFVDRLWARGISKEKAVLTEWTKEIAPTTELRKWFGHDANEFSEFEAKYIAELNANPETPAFVADIKQRLADGDVTLLFGAKDEAHNNAVVLRAYLKERLTN